MRYIEIWYSYKILDYSYSDKEEEHPFKAKVCTLKDFGEDI